MTAPAAAGAAGTQITIRKFQPGDAAAVRRMFYAGLQPLWRPFTRRVLREPSALAAAALAMALVALRSTDLTSGLIAVVIVGVAVVAVAAAYSWTQFTLYTSHSLSDDLKDIQAFYMENKQCPGSCFWVAEAVPDAAGGKPSAPVIVGCVGLEEKSPEQGELRRMSVDDRWQRRGIAAQLCRALLAHAKAVGFKEVYLTTSEMQQGACRLYERMGWAEVERGPLLWPMCYHKFSQALWLDN